MFTNTSEIEMLMTMGPIWTRIHIRCKPWVDSDILSQPPTP